MVWRSPTNVFCSISPLLAITQVEFFFVIIFGKKCNSKNQTPFSGAMAAVIVFREVRSM